MNAVARKQAVAVRAQATVRPTAVKPVAKKPSTDFRAATAAVFTAVALMAAPVSIAADATVKQTVCASNPTAAICLKDSAKQ